MRARTRHSAAAVIAAAALCFTAVACSGSDDDKKSSPSGEPTGTVRAATADDSDNAGGSQKPADARAEPLTAAQMKAATLQVKDLPPGYTAGQSVPDRTKYTADQPQCQPIAEFLDGEVTGATTGGSVDFEGPGGKSMLTQQVFTFPGKGAEDLVKGVGTALESCTKFTYKDADGEKSEIGVRKIDGPEAGEESHAFRMTMATAGSPIKVEVDMLVARQGTGGTRIGFLAPDAEGRKAFPDLAKRAGDKLVKAVRG
ncbi:hypothetical protein [Streptomyces sp. NPDC004726]